MDFSIGKVAQLTGLSVKTIRYYADIGLVAEASRSESGYRRFDERSLARLELVRALRELGLDLGAVREITERKSSLGDIATAQADAVEAHINQLKLRRSVLRAIARGTSGPTEVQRMTAYAQASSDEVRRIMDDFLATVFEGHEDDPFAARMKAALPVLPDDPSDAQVDAWIELAQLVHDDSFRTRVQEMIIEGEKQRRAGDTDTAGQQSGQKVVEAAGAALAAGTSPKSPEARRTVDEVVAAFATAAGKEDSASYRQELLKQMQTFGDRRVNRYWQLIGVINGWPQRPDMFAPYEWFIEALKTA